MFLWVLRRFVEEMTEKVIFVFLQAYIKITKPVRGAVDCRAATGK